MMHFLKAKEETAGEGLPESWEDNLGEGVPVEAAMQDPESQREAWASQCCHEHKKA